MVVVVVVVGGRRMIRRRGFGGWDVCRLSILGWLAILATWHGVLEYSLRALSKMIIDLYLGMLF